MPWPMPPRAQAAAILWTKSVDSVMCPAMSLASITVRVPTPLRACCGGSAELSVDAADLRDALANLERRYPALYISVCDETGAVRRHVGVFVNSDHLRDREGLDTKLVGGDVVSIFQAVSGG